MYNIIITMFLINNIHNLNVFLLIIAIIVIGVLYYIFNKHKTHRSSFSNIKPTCQVDGLTESEKLVEGFNINDIGKIIDDVKKIGNVANGITGEIKGIGKEITNGVKQIENTGTSITNQIDGKLNKFGEVLENKILDKVQGIVNNVKSEIIDIVEKMIDVAKNQILGQIENMIEVLKEEVMDQVTQMIKTLENKVFSKISEVFMQIPKILNNAIVKPLMALFKGIGNIFIKIFEILKKIAYKVVSLPGCILYYLINGIVSSITGFLSWITPSWIEEPISAIWNATFGAILSWILNGLGYTDASRKCYAFNVDEEVNGMNTQLKNITNAFTKDFGKNIKFKI